jgi:sugar/nucleoside kinase (ribokinase family)
VRAKVFYLGGYLVMPSIQAEEIGKVFAAARRAGVITVLDVVTPGPGDYLAQMEGVLPYVDVFLPNQDEAQHITGASDPVQQCKALRELGVGTVIITMGANGALLVTEGQRLRAGVYPVTYVDGSGGGDAFDAGYIYGLLNGMDPVDCLRVASALGASCVRAVGTTPGVFTRTECETFLRNHQLIVEAM